MEKFYVPIEKARRFTRRLYVPFADFLALKTDAELNDLVGEAFALAVVKVGESCTIEIESDEFRARREAAELEYEQIRRAHKKQWILDRLNGNLTETQIDAMLESGGQEVRS